MPPETTENQREKHENQKSTKKAKKTNEQKK